MTTSYGAAHGARARSNAIRASVGALNFSLPRWRYLSANSIRATVHLCRKKSCSIERALYLRPRRWP